MFTEDKVIEIFFMADEFCKFFNAMMEKHTLQRVGKRNYHRNGTLSKAEVMVIIILFHNSGYRCQKHFYLKYVVGGAGATQKAEESWLSIAASFLCDIAIVNQRFSSESR